MSEEKAKEKLEKIRASKRKWWNSSKGKAWKQARKEKEVLGERKDPPKP